MITTIVNNNEFSTRRKAALSSEKVITDFISSRNNKSLKDLKGKISFRDDYNYKLLRS